MDSFDILSDSEEALLDEIIVNGQVCRSSSTSNYRQFKRLQYMQRLQHYGFHQQEEQLEQTFSNDISASTSTSAASCHRLPYIKQQESLAQYYDPMESPIHYCDNVTHYSDDNVGGNMYECSQEHQQEQLYNQQPRAHSSAGAYIGTFCRSSESSTSVGSTTATTVISNEDGGDYCIALPINTPGQLELEVHEVQEISSKSPVPNVQLQEKQPQYNSSCTTSGANAYCGSNGASSSMASTSNGTALSAGASFNNQLTTDMCSHKNSKSRRLEYSLKCLKYGRSNPSQDSAFGSLTDNDLSIGSSSFRLSSFQSISSPIDEGVEEVIIATTTAGNETCLELATIPRSMVSQDSAISSPCRETSPSNFLNIDDGLSSVCSGGSSTSGSTGNVRPQQFPVSLSPKILVTATSNSSNSSLASTSAGQSSTGPSHQQQPQQQQQQFDPPKILVNDQNSIYTTSPSKRSGTIEVFSQKYRVSSFEDMSPNKRLSSGSDKHLKNANRMAFRSLEEERRIDSAFIPITDRTNSDNRVNFQSEKYKKLTHASFRISKTSSQVAVYDTSPGQLTTSTPGSSTMISSAGGALDLQRPATASGSISSRQTMWRDSKFYRKNRIAKSNDSLLETSPNHSARLSPSSLRDNHYDSSCSSHAGSRSHSRQSLNRGGSINEMASGSNNMLGLGLAVTTSFCGNPLAVINSRRYCSSKSEDLGETSNDYLRVMDARKSYSERHLVTLTKLKQTAITNSSPGCSDQCCMSEDEMSFNEDNNASGASGGSNASNRHQLEFSPQQQQSLQSQQRQYNQRQRQQQQYAQKSHSQQSNYTMHSHANQQQQLSWSNTSINRMKATNIKTTFLATLTKFPQNLKAASSSHSSTSTSATSSVMESRSPQLMVRNAAFKTLTDSSGNSATGSGNVTTTEENSSSADESPHHTLSAAELSRIFAMDEAQGSSCSEEKTPLLDSVEMSPMISPTESVKDQAD